MAHSRLARAALLTLFALVLAIAASAADAVLGDRIGSQTIAWALGAVMVLMAVRGAVARVSGVASEATSAP